MRARAAPWVLLLAVLAATVLVFGWGGIGVLWGLAAIAYVGVRIAGFMSRFYQ